MISIAEKCFFVKTCPEGQCCASRLGSMFDSEAGILSLIPMYGIAIVEAILVIAHDERIAGIDSDAGEHKIRPYARIIDDSSLHCVVVRLMLHISSPLQRAMLQSTAALAPCYPRAADVHV